MILWMISDPFALSITNVSCIAGSCISTAACALAYDQIHLTEQQKVKLFDALIEALGDDKLDVRNIALLALQIHTGQTKGFNPNASLTEREQKVGLWRQWLTQYKSGL